MIGGKAILRSVVETEERLSWIKLIDNHIVSREGKDIFKITEFGNLIRL